MLHTTNVTFEPARENVAAVRTAREVATAVLDVLYAVAPVLLGRRLVIEPTLCPATSVWRSRGDVEQLSAGCCVCTGVIRMEGRARAQLLPARAQRVDVRAEPVALLLGHGCGLSRRRDAARRRRPVGRLVHGNAQDEQGGGCATVVSPVTSKCASGTVSVLTDDRALAAARAHHLRLHVCLLACYPPSDSAGCRRRSALAVCDERSSRGRRQARACAYGAITRTSSRQKLPTGMPQRRRGREHRASLRSGRDDGRDGTSRTPDSR